MKHETKIVIMDTYEKFSTDGTIHAEFLRYGQQMTSTYNDGSLAHTSTMCINSIECVINFEGFTVVVPASEVHAMRTRGEFSGFVSEIKRVVRECRFYDKQSFLSVGKRYGFLLDEYDNVVMTAVEDCPNDVYVFTRSCVTELLNVLNIPF